MTAGVGAWAIGCSSDDDPNLTGTGNDSGVETDGEATAPGTDGGGSANDSGGSDAGVDSGGGADAGAIPGIALVHAAPDVPAVRFCFGVSPTGALGGTFAKPNFTGGLPFGAGGALAVLAANAVLLTSVDVYIWAIPASSFPSADDAGLDDAGLDPNDCATAVHLPGSMLFAKVPKGTIQYDHSYIVALDGCQSPADAGEAVCGSATTDGGTTAFPSGAALGSLRLEVIAVDNATPVPAGTIGAQFVQLSPSLQALAPYQGAGVIPGIALPGDAGTDEAGQDAAPSSPVYDYANITTTPVTYNGEYAGPPGSTVASPSPTFTGTAVTAANLSTAGIGFRTSALAAPIPALAYIPLGSVATATLGPQNGAPRSASALFTLGKSYTFVTIGNVGAPQTSPNFFRVIALPSVP